MPADFDIAYLFRVDMIGEIHGQLTQNSFHFSVYGDLLANNPHQLGSGLLQDFITGALPVVRQVASQQWAVKLVYCSSMIPKSEVLYEQAIPEGGGFQPDDSLPSHDCFLLRLRTGYGGRSRNGSLHLAGVPEGSSSNSRIEGSLLTDLRGVGDFLIARYGVGGSSDGYLWGLYSRKLGDTRIPGPPPAIAHSLTGFYPVVSVVASNEVSTILKRRLHRGE
jgi:hypothetical protein